MILSEVVSTGKMLFTHNILHFSQMLWVGQVVLSHIADKTARQIGELLQSHKIDPERFYYFGEMIFDPKYRHQGIGKRMLEMLKNAGHQQGADRFCFLAVAREADDTRRPADHIDSELMFRKFGFLKTDVFVMFEWPTLQPDGRVEKISNRLDLWIDALATGASL